MDSVIKWVGGKRKLLPFIHKNLPELPYRIRYVEPFCGSASVYLGLRDMLSNHIWEETTLSDKEASLINVLKCIQYDRGGLLSLLERLQRKYDRLPSMAEKKNMYHESRGIYNTLTKTSAVLHSMFAAYFIFLNRTCFNGLYRTNKADEFNVPFGNYPNAKIYQKDPIEKMGGLLCGVRINCCPFKNTIKYVGKDTFVYLDPPYKNRWTKYDGVGFGAYEFLELLSYMDNCDCLGAKVMLSYNEDCRDLLKSGTWRIESVEQPCTINPQKSQKRTEYLIMNY